MSATADTSREERIRARAYEIWESEGRAEGHHERHWREASRHVEESEAGGQPADAFDGGAGSAGAATAAKAAAAGEDAAAGKAADEGTRRPLQGSA